MVDGMTIEGGESSGWKMDDSNREICWGLQDRFVFNNVRRLVQYSCSSSAGTRSLTRFLTCVNQDHG